MTSHELSRALLETPDQPVAVAGHGALSFLTRAAAEDGARVVLYVEEPQTNGPRTSSLTLRVVGIAKPQGSARAFIPKGWTRPIITSDNKGMKPWRDLVASTASDAVQAASWVLPQGAVRVMIDFYLPRPKALRKHTPPHLTKPDLDKLTRAVKDAIRGVVYNDDAQVTELKARKFYAAIGEAPHAVIVVTPL